MNVSMSLIVDAQHSPFLTLSILPSIKRPWSRVSPSFETLYVWTTKIGRPTLRYIADCTYDTRLPCSLYSLFSIIKAA